MSTASPPKPPNRYVSKRAFVAMGASAAVAAGLPGGQGAAAACDRVVVGTWGGDFANALQATVGTALRASQGVEFVAAFGDAGSRKTRLIAERSRKASSADIVCFDGFDMSQMANLDLLLPIDPAQITNAANILPGFARAYSVPLAFSAKVIVYNPDRMPAPKSYRNLWSSAYAGKVGLADLLAVAAIESAALIAGGSARNYEPGKQKLLDLKATGVKIYPSNEALAVGLATGEVWATIMWRARAVQWKNAGLPVANAVPEEGATPIVFEIAAPRNTSSPACATAFLNHALDRHTQAEFAVRMGYSPTVRDAELPADLARDLAFSAEQHANFFQQDFAYLTQNQGQLLDWWSRVFKG